MQGVPLLPDSVAAAGLKDGVPPFSAHVLSPSAMRRLAGNSFNQPCWCAFFAFVSAMLEAA